MRGIKKIIVFTLMLAFLFTVAACGGKAAKKENNIEMVSLYNTMTLERSAEITGYPMAQFAVEAAKGETDGAQIVICPEQKISAYTATVSDLTGPNGAVISAKNMTLYVEIYARVVDGSEEFPAGYYPDALIPLPYIENAHENFVEAGNNQAFWLDIAVPEDVSAGDYTGSVTFLFDGEKREVPIRLTVFDFTMPKVTYMESSYLIWRNWVIQGELDNTTEMWETYFDFLLDYNLVGYDLPCEPGDIEAYKAAVRKYYDLVPNYFIPFKSAGNFVIDYDFAYDYLYAIAEISLEDGINYFDKAKYYIHSIYDECNHDSVKEIRYPATKVVLEKMDETEEQVVADLIEQGKLRSRDDAIAAGLLSVQHVMTTTYIEELAEDYGVDLFCPGYGYFNTTDNIEYYQQLMEEGIDIYSYGAMNGGLTGSVLINDYTISGRDIMWSKYAYGVTGDLYWNATGYMAWWQFVGTGYGLINDLYTQASHDGLSNGDGYLLYPGAQYGSEKPFPSIRLTERRDGIDDYDYMSLLQDRYDQLAEEYNVSEGFDANQVLQPLFDSVFSLGSSKLNYDGLADARRAIASLIEMAESDAGFVVNELKLEKEGIRYSLYAEPQTKIKVDGSWLSPSSTGKSIGYISYPKDGILRIEVESEGKTYKAEIYVGNKPELVNSFEDEESIAEVEVSARGSEASLNTDPAYAVSGNSLQIKLQGWKDPNGGVTVFNPFAYMPIEGLADTAFIEFEVYNPGEDITVNIEAMNQAGISYGLDTVTLKSGTWTKIRLGNFNTISTDDATLSKITAIGIVASKNLLDSSGTAYAHTLYIDEFYRTMEVK